MAGRRRARGLRVPCVPLVCLRAILLRLPAVGIESPSVENSTLVF